MQSDIENVNTHEKKDINSAWDTHSFINTFNEFAKIFKLDFVFLLD